MATRVVQVCRYLRTKALYIPDPRGNRVLVEPTDSGYWCNLTGAITGPDQDFTGPRECDEKRTCFEGMPLVLVDDEG